MAAACAVALVVGGCATGAGNGTGTHYWLIRVEGRYASIYRYPPGNKPRAGTPAVFLGVGLGAKNRTNLDAAAKRLGVPPSHISDES